MQIDNFLSARTISEVRQQALNAVYEDWLGPDNIVYKRIAVVDIPEIRDRLAEIYGEVDVLGMAFRANMNGEPPNQSIHTDVGWGTHAMVLYLTDGDSGTAFWKHIPSGRVELPPFDIHAFIDVRKDWTDESKWMIYDEIQMKYNRAALYKSQLFHSRWPFKAFGTCMEDCRLTLVCFFTPLMKPDWE